MATVGGRPAGLRRRLSRRALLNVTVVAVLIAGVAALDDRPAAAGGPSAAEAVPAMVAAYGSEGTLAVVVARQQEPFAGLPLRGFEARLARVADSSADNGAVASRPFPTASLVKLFVAEDILHRARAGLLTLAPHDVGLLREMIRRSDDAAASTLWVRYGGDGMVSDVAARYGLSGTAPPSSPGQWGETTTTARDLARFLSLLPVVAHPVDAATLLGWMREATPVAADGFDQQFGLFGTAPPRTPVKQGWMCCVGGTRHLHSVAVIGHRVVVMLSEVPQYVSYAEASAALDAAAAALPPPRHL
jgi:CubicO group peptidase (beta-lactamase class C family)